MTSDPDRPGIYVSRHVVQRISERAGVEMTWRDVFALISEDDLARMETGAHVVARVKRLALDLVCRNRAITTALHAHAWNGAAQSVDHYDWISREERKSEAARRARAARRTRQAHLFEDEIVVGGRVRRTET